MKRIIILCSILIILYAVSYSSDIIVIQGITPPAESTVLEYVRLLEHIKIKYPALKIVRFNPPLMLPDNNRMLIEAYIDNRPDAYYFIYELTNGSLLSVPERAEKERIIIYDWSPSGNQIVGSLWQWKTTMKPGEGRSTFSIYKFFLYDIISRETFSAQLFLCYPVLLDDNIILIVNSPNNDNRYEVKRIIREGPRLTLPKKLSEFQLPNNGLVIGKNLGNRNNNLYVFPYYTHKPEMPRRVYGINLETGDMRTVLEMENYNGGDYLFFSPRKTRCLLDRKIYDTTVEPWSLIKTIPRGVKNVGWWNEDIIILECMKKEEYILKSGEYPDPTEYVGALMPISGQPINLEKIPLLFMPKQN